MYSAAIYGGVAVKALAHMFSSLSSLPECFTRPPFSKIGRKNFHMAPKPPD